MAHVLVVDDEKSIRLLLRTLLESAGHTVEEASSGEEALARCRQDESELGGVILDHRLPGVQGSEVAQALRAEGFDVPVVLHSAFLTPELAAEAERTGVVAVDKGETNALLDLVATW
jgi:two-component system, OmpR family, response regulator